MQKSDLKNALDECKKTARIGYKIAERQEKNLENTLISAQKEIQSTIENFYSSPYYAPETATLLENQLRNIGDSLGNLTCVFKEDLQNLRANLSKFSITLFGRTMAGKSTLMEILTEGDGSSIGKGAQRTTKDVRTYTWNGMEITDVPGTGAVDGEEDEQIAFEAAKKADLILFLITDDGPKEPEAKWFSKIINLGKPVICIMNVKTGNLESSSFKMGKYDIGERFDMERLYGIRNQFLVFAEKYGQTWTHIPFVYVHLQAAYVAQHSEDQEKSTTYHELSKIEELKRALVEQVALRGRFYRMKTFIDIISNPTLKSMEHLLEESRLNGIQGRIIRDKKNQFENWMNRFERDGRSQIQSLVMKIKNDLHGEIASFAEDHFEDPNADKSWKQLLLSRKLEVRCQELLNDLEAKCDDKMREISREIVQELEVSVSFADDESLKMEKIFDGRKVWSWSTLTIGSGFGVAAGIAYFLEAGTAVVSCLGGIGTVIGVIGAAGAFLMRNREEKEQEARIKLENNLKANVSKICEVLQKKMESNFELLVKEKIKQVLNAMEKVDSVVFQLAETQKKLAWRLNAHLMELNGNIVEEAIKMTGADGLQYHIISVARIPGNVSMIKLNDETVFPKEQTEELQDLMSERIWFVSDTDNKKRLLFRVLGEQGNSDFIHMEEEQEIAYISFGKITQEMKLRIRLAQQFTELAIRKQ